MQIHNIKPTASTVFSPSLGRWTLNVERWTFALIVLVAIISNSRAKAQDAPPAPRRALPSLSQWELSGGPQDPIQAIDHHMSYIVDDLGDRKTDQPVQTKQKKVIGELDVIIKQMEEEQKKSKTGRAKMNPSQPAMKSTLAKGPGGQGPLHDPKAGTKQWGDLTPKEREQIMQSQTEGFPPGYEAVLASYYNRLAQEKVAAENATGPTTRPGEK